MRRSTTSTVMRSALLSALKSSTKFVVRFVSPRTTIRTRVAGCANTMDPDENVRQVTTAYDVSRIRKLLSTMESLMENTGVHVCRDNRVRAVMLGGGRMLSRDAARVDRPMTTVTARHETALQARFDNWLWRRLVDHFEASSASIARSL